MVEFGRYVKSLEIPMGSPVVGFDFACRQADWVFIAPPKGLLEEYKTLAQKANAVAAKYGRKIKVGAMCYALIEPTDAEAG